MHSVEQLVDTLRRFAAQKPRVMILGKRNGPQMFIGVWSGTCCDGLIPTTVHTPLLVRQTKGILLVGRRVDYE